MEQMGMAALELLEEFYAQSLLQQRCDLTVEITEMKRACYFKLSSLR
jgi:5-carboxymethyl-2-hydroxymuconate isomerase